MTSPVAVSERAPTAYVCPRCQTRNPASGKFCVSCGTPIGEGAKPAFAPAPDMRMPEPEPERVIEPVRPAAMVNLAPDRRAPVSLTCDRCQGICEAGMRFCKFCGAPLPQGDGPAPAPAVVDRAQEYGKAASTRQGLQAAIEEAARQVGTHSPKQVAQHVPVAPTAQGDDAQTVRGRMSGAQEGSGPDRRDAGDISPETA
jgi:hypothetical protein